jgi:hypothetical protein
MKKGLILIPLILAGVISIVAMRDDDSGSHVSIVRKSAPLGSLCQTKSEMFIKNTHATKHIHVIYNVTQGDGTVRKAASLNPNSEEFIGCEASSVNVAIASTQYQ